MTVACSCGTRWSGQSRCHCAGCHRMFSGLTTFDLHRRAGVCVDPETVTKETGEPRMVARRDKQGNTLWGLPGTWQPDTDEGDDDD